MSESRRNRWKGDEFKINSRTPRGFKAGIAQGEAHESGTGFHQCSEPLGMLGDRRCHGWCTRGEPETLQNFPASVWRMNRCQNSHAPQAAGALQYIQGPDALHQFSPRIVSPMSTGWG